VLRPAQLGSSRDALIARWRRTNILLNAAGDNVPGTMLAVADLISDLAIEAFHQAIDFNLSVECPWEEHPAAKAATNNPVHWLVTKLACSPVPNESICAPTRSLLEIDDSEP